MIWQSKSRSAWTVSLFPEGHRWSLPLGQPGLLSGTTGHASLHPHLLSTCTCERAAEGVRLSFNKVTFSKLLLSEVSGLQLHSVEAFELESAGTKRYSQRRRRGRSGGFCDPPLLFLFSCTAVRCTFEANTWCGVTLGGVCFSFYLQNCNNRQSKTVLNSHQKSGCVCSLVTFSLLFVCVLVSVCVRAAFRWLLPPPAAPLQLPAGRRRLRSLLHRPGTPVWGESWLSCHLMHFSRIKTLSAALRGDWPSMSDGHIIGQNCLKWPRREVLFVSLCFAALFGS